MAVIRKRGDQQWQAIVRKKGSPPVSKTFTHKADAERWARRTELSIERGEIDAVNQATQRITVAEVITEYSAIKLPTLASPSMRKVELRRIGQAFGPLYIATLRAPAINQWVRDFSNKPLPRSKAPPSAGTVTHHINRLSGLIDFARRHMGVHMLENPVRLVTRPKAAQGRTRRLEAHEEEYLLKCAADTDQLLHLIILAIETSMRLGELLSLKWDLINLEQQTAHLPTTKNGDARTVGLSKRAVASFEALRQSNIIDINKKVFHWKKSDSFTHTWKRLIERAQILYTKEMKKSEKAINTRFLENFRFHDLRHEAISRLFEEKGLGVMEVASMTGHKSLAMLKRYTHVFASDLAKKKLG